MQDKLVLAIDDSQKKLAKKKNHSLEKLHMKKNDSQDRIERNDSNEKLNQIKSRNMNQKQKKIYDTITATYLSRPSVIKNKRNTLA